MLGKRNRQDSAGRASSKRERQLTPEELQDLAADLADQREIERLEREIQEMEEAQEEADFIARMNAASRAEQKHNKPSRRKGFTKKTYAQDNYRFQPAEGWQQSEYNRRQDILNNQEPAYEEKGDPIPFFKGQTQTQDGVLYVLKNGRLAVGQFNPQTGKAKLRFLAKKDYPTGDSELSDLEIEQVLADYIHRRGMYANRPPLSQRGKNLAIGYDLKHSVRDYKLARTPMEWRLHPIKLDVKGGADYGPLNTWWERGQPTKTGKTREQLYKDLLGRSNARRKQPLSQEQITAYYDQYQGRGFVPRYAANR